METLRDAPLGQLVRLIWKPQFLLYPEERPGFEVPSFPSPSKEGDDSLPDVEKQALDEPLDENRDAVPNGASKLDDTILVDWYSDTDPGNPQNWSSGRKVWLTFMTSILFWATYGASSIYVAAIPGIMDQFGVPPAKASLGLSLYVVGIGIGPMLWGPLTEIPVVGRMIPLVITITIFLVLAVPTAIVNDYPSLMALRALTGFFGSIPAGSGPATLQDIYAPMFAPIAICMWLLAGFSGPALAPLLSGYAVMYEGWHWALWLILWIIAPIYVLLWLTMPETYAANLLLRRAARLRKLTGNQNYRSRSELVQAHMSATQVVHDALIKPLEITLLDPAILFANLYLMYIYGTYYSFFESFPIVFQGFYGFDLGQLGLAFLPISVGAVLGVVVYIGHLALIIGPTIKKKGDQPQEFFLTPALYGCLAIPISLFWFGWTSRPDIHWISPMLAVMVYAAGAFVTFQSVFGYLPLSYPPYAASLFSANDFFRSSFAAGAVEFSRPMFVNLGIGRGISLLGGLGVGGVIGIWVLWFFGAKLRARSRFALS